VWVTPFHFYVRWSNQNHFAYSWQLEQFHTATAERQVSEIMAVVWGGPMKRKDVARLPGVKVHADPGALKGKFPNVAEFLTAAVFDGGKEARIAPTVTIWAAGGQWKLNVKDREEKLVLWLSADDPMQLLVMLEEFCLSPQAPWRHDDQEHASNGKRVKKSS
jgi:hypothetical protein